MKPIATTITLIVMLSLFCVSATHAGTVTDIDGNVYQTVSIGTQVWMAENLKVTHYRNGDAIPNATINATWVGLTSGAYGEYDNDSNYVVTYGRLYNWYAVADGRDIAPEGWHVPTDAEWKQLEMYLGMSQAQADSYGRRGTTEGGKLKEEGYTHWTFPNSGATNSSGFTALPGGYRIYSNGAYADLNTGACFWSSSESNTSNAWTRSLNYAPYTDIARFDYRKDNGYSIRCVQDVAPCCLPDSKLRGDVSTSGGTLPEGDGATDGSDLGAYVDYVFFADDSSFRLDCTDVSDLNNDATTDGGDLGILVDYIFFNDTSVIKRCDGSPF